MYISPTPRIRYIVKGGQAMTKINRNDIFDLLRGALLALLISIAGVIILAVIAKFADLSDGVITGVNIGVRILSILLGMLIGVRAGRYFIAKGVAVGGIFALITYILSVILAGGFNNSAMTLYDALACILAGIISGGICAVLPRK